MELAVPKVASEIRLRPLFARFWFGHFKTDEYVINAVYLFMGT
jgi:hypothetical protein